MTTKNILPDIKPQTHIAELHRDRFLGNPSLFRIEDVAILVGMQVSFVKKILGRHDEVSIPEVLRLLDQDAFRETLVPRSKIIDHLLQTAPRNRGVQKPSHLDVDRFSLWKGHVLDMLSRVPSSSVQCVVTSTPYWGMRLYKDSFVSDWADGEVCAFGHEQTPESFCRHTTEVLAALFDVLADDGSIWWNVMDTFNTRTQIRGNAAEALRAMQGNDRRTWAEHDCRRYSAGHSYLKDGEQCGIPGMIAERASRIGYFVKSVITWAKTSTLPEPQDSRVSRNLEYVLHLTKVRTPRFDKSVYRMLPAQLGGRNNGSETDKLSDVWTLPTSSGRDGHGAQFPIALPARCIALSTKPTDLVLDPFVGAGNAGIAAVSLRRRFLGIDVSRTYLETATSRISKACDVQLESSVKRPDLEPCSEMLL